MSVADDMVLSMPCRLCGGRVVFEQALIAQKDNPDVTEILERGLAAKRSGNITQAIALYKEAQKMAPADDRPYGNLAKALSGSRQYAEALRYWLIICELNRLNPAGGSSAQAAELPRFSAQPLVWENQRLETTTVASLLRQKPYLGELIYRADNLTFYLGHCVVRLQPAATVAYKIPSEFMANLESALVGKPVGEDLRGSRWEHVFLLAGFYFAALNIAAVDLDIISAAERYLNPEFGVTLSIGTVISR